VRINQNVDAMIMAALRTIDFQRPPRKIVRLGVTALTVIL